MLAFRPEKRCGRLLGYGERQWHHQHAAAGDAQGDIPPAVTSPQPDDVLMRAAGEYVRGIPASLGPQVGVAWKPSSSAPSKGAPVEAGEAAAHVGLRSGAGAIADVQPGVA